MASSNDDLCRTGTIKARPVSSLPITSRAESQKESDDAEDDMFMMFSTSPDLLRHENPFRHSGRTRDITSVFAKTTTEEMAAFSEYAIPINRQEVRPSSASIIEQGEARKAIDNSNISDLTIFKNTSALHITTDNYHNNILESPSSRTSSATTPSSAFEFSPVHRTLAIAVSSQRNIANSSLINPLASPDSCFSYESYSTCVTSPATSPDSRGENSMGNINSKGKGREISHEDTNINPIKQDLTQFYTPSDFIQSSPDELAAYMPDPADLIPSLDWNVRAFNWEEFERSMQASPGAGPSTSGWFQAMTPELEGALIFTVPSYDSPQQVNETMKKGIEPHVYATMSGNQDPTPATVQDSKLTMQSELNRGYRSDSALRATSISQRPHSSFLRGTLTDMKQAPDTVSINQSQRVQTSLPSRPASLMDSSKAKRKSLPAWIAKVRDGKASSTGENATFGELDVIVHEKARPRRLFKERARSHTLPPFLPSSVPLEVQFVPTSEKDDPLAKDVVTLDEAAKVQEPCLFDTYLPPETKIHVFSLLLLLHQEEFERRLNEGQWSIAHASRERWVGKDAGMRELVKLCRVSKHWQDLCLDGQLWFDFNLQAFPNLSTSLVLKIARAAGGFLQNLNLQGHSRMKSHSLLALASSASLSTFDTQTILPVTQLQTINLIGCNSITTHSLHYLLLRSPLLRNVFLRGLESVTDTTLTEIIGPHCPLIASLDIRRCGNVNGKALAVFSEQSEARALKNASPAPLKTLRVSGMKGTDAGVLRAVGRAFPLLEILDVGSCRELEDECFRAFVEWPEISPVDPYQEKEPLNWTKFAQGIELSSRAAGFDPGDPTKYWRRITRLRHLVVSGSRRITDQTCTALAFAVPDLQFLEMAGIGGNLRDDGLLRLFRTTPLIRKIDIEDASEITDAVLETLTPTTTTEGNASGRRGTQTTEDAQPGQFLEHFVISYAMTVTPEAMGKLVRGCKKLRVFEADNTRMTGSILRDFVNRRRHREKGEPMPEGSEIVAIDCRGVSENSVRDLRMSTRPRRGWRHWEARDIGYEDGAAVGVLDASGVVVGSLIGQDECDERRVVVKSFHNWVAVDSVAEERSKQKLGREKQQAEVPRWLTHWSLGRRSGSQTSSVSTPEERGGEDRGCVVM